MTSLSVNIFSLYKNAQSGYSHQTKRNIKLHETDNYKYRFLKTQNVFPSPLSTCSIYWSPSFSSFSCRVLSTVVPGIDATISVIAN